MKNVLFSRSFTNQHFFFIALQPSALFINYKLFFSSPPSRKFAIKSLYNFATHTHTHVRVVVGYLYVENISHCNT